ncbi:MAG TPA: enoyl-CoA hydratase/isomerase family protein [Kiloniellales bacterium]
MSKEDLLYEISDAIGWVTFNRPDQRNALTFAMYEGLAEICSSAPSDGSVKAIVIRGAGGRAFAAGTDMAQFRAFNEPEDGWGYEARMDHVLDRIERCPVPTIAAITGACTGGGAAIAACCDLRIADQRLKFGFPIARTLGNCLSVTSLARLAAIIGQARVREIIFTARLIGAQEAQAVGLVSEVLEDAAAVISRAGELAQLVASHAPLTLRVTKEGLRRLFHDGPGADDRDLIEAAYMSADFKEGMDAFLAKRPPQWKGR